jgi:hypothetical protein
MAALRSAAGYEPFLWNIPETSSDVKVAPRGNFEDRCNVPAGAYLWAVSAFSAAAAGFKLNISDLTSGYHLFSQAVRSDNISGAGANNSAGIFKNLFELDKPRGFPAPGLISAQITNLDTDPAGNSIQLTLYFMQPFQDASDAAAVRPNRFNAILAADLDLTRRALRGSAAGPLLAPIPGGLSTQQGNPLVHMPANGRPFHFQKAIATPAAGTSDVEIVSFRVPNGYTAVTAAVANGYTGTNFEEGSGDLIWRYSVDGAYPPGFDDVETSLGTFQQPRQLEGPIIAYAGQLVRCAITVAPGIALPTGTAARSFACFDGWFYPQ